MQVLSYPFQRIMEFIREAWQYQTKLSEDSYQIQQILATSVKFSGDQAENFNRAGIAARQMMTAVQDMAIILHQPEDKVKNSVLAFISGGGLATVKTLREGLEAVKLLNFAVMGSGATEQMQRRLINEIPRLLNGTIDDESSKILQTLGLTNDEWVSILEHTEKNGDLVGELLAKLMDF